MNVLNFMLILVSFMPSAFKVSSPSFNADGIIPVKYSCSGSNINPALSFKNYPVETVSLALIMDDPDATSGTFVHWVVWNIPPTAKIDENSAPGMVGMNGKGENKYQGPCPPEGPVHHYHFKIYALNTRLDLPAHTDKEALLKAMEDHILGTGEIIGLYKKL